MITAEEKASLFKEWQKHKKAEETAKKKRIEVEAQLESCYGEFEGKSKTFNEDDLGFKVNFKKNVSVKLDQDAWKSTRLNVPEDLRPEKIKFELDEKGFEYLKENNKDIYKMVSACVEIKPGKTTVKVEKI